MDLERLIDDWRGPLIGLLASWGMGWDAARELAADVFAEAYLGRERFRGSFDDADRVGPWLVGIARNLRRARARDLARRRALDVDGLEPAIEPAAFRDQDQDRGGRAALVREAVARLGEEHRQAIYVCYFEERPVRQAAALLGISEKALEGRLYRARLALRRLLGADARAVRPRRPRAENDPEVSR